MLFAIPFVQNPEYLFVLSRTAVAYVISLAGRLVYTVKTDDDRSVFVGGCMSSHVGGGSGVEGRGSTCTA